MIFLLSRQRIRLDGETLVRLTLDRKVASSNLIFGQNPFLYLKTSSLLHCNIYFNMSLYKTLLRNCSVFDSRSKGCMFKSCGVKCTEFFFIKTVSLLNCIIYFNTSLFKTPWRNGSTSDSR